jgi:tetratricopeptide (TPR) repeat protein
MRQDDEPTILSEMLIEEDALYEIILNKKPIINNLFKFNDFKIKELCANLSNQHIDYGDKIFTYMEEIFLCQSLDEIRIYRIFMYYALSSESLVNEKYKKLFVKYLQYGNLYIEKTYKKDIIENELYYYMKSEEDLFLMYMYHAEKNKNNGVTYLRYLKKALLACTDMKNGIELLYKDMEETMAETQDKMNEYKIKVKESIASLINDNNLASARAIIAEYETIAEADANLISMKAVIEIMENNLQVAEEILLWGIKKYKDNFDLIYNIAYLYELMKDRKKAINFYEKAVTLTKDKNYIKEVTDKLKELKN